MRGRQRRVEPERPELDVEFEREARVLGCDDRSLHFFPSYIPNDERPALAPRSFAHQVHLNG